jgi:phage tail-like protein
MRNKKRASRANYFNVYRFQVEIDNLQIAGFREVSGLDIEIETETYQEGGLNSLTHHFYKQTKYSPLVLKRGMSDAIGASFLWNWFSDWQTGKRMEKKNGQIILYNEANKVACRWTFYQALPIGWAGPEFNAERSEVAIETLKIQHEGIKLMMR